MYCMIIIQFLNALSLWNSWIFDNVKLLTWDYFWKKFVSLKKIICFCGYHYFITSPSPFSLSLSALSNVRNYGRRERKKKNPKVKNLRDKRKVWRHKIIRERWLRCCKWHHIISAGTLTKKKSNFPHIQYKEIQNGALAKSYMTNGLLIYGDLFAHFLTY
jgi:hypothetical protein